MDLLPLGKGHDRLLSRYKLGLGEEMPWDQDQISERMTTEFTQECWHPFECIIKVVLWISEQTQVGFSCCHRKELLLSKWWSVAMVILIGKKKKKKKQNSSLQSPSVKTLLGNYWRSRHLVVESQFQHHKTECRVMYSKQYLARYKATYIVNNIKYWRLVSKLLLYRWWVQVSLPPQNVLIALLCYQ